ncbi:MAG: hypothetical protein JWQ09_5536 [Segetibacter sp.]|nr:hypothetical protein [Segetibacter sp.]
MKTKDAQWFTDKVIATQQCHHENGGRYNKKQIHKKKQLQSKSLYSI